MKLIQQPGGPVYVAEAPVWDPSHASLDGRDHLLIGVNRRALEAKAERGQRWHLGQMYGLLCPGLIMTRWLFQGLKRGMHVEGNPSAASTKLAATWAPHRDAELVGPPEAVELQYSSAPADAVFVVYISPNLMLGEFPLVYGWAEHWAWVSADAEMAGAPIDHGNRFDRLLWNAP